MLSALVVGLFQAGSVLAPAPGAGPRPAVVAPEWLRRPTYDDVKRYYPEAARKTFLAGRATIACSVTAEGTLTECSVVSEDPVGEGFGDGALRMRVLFKMRPATENGMPVKGGTVRIPIRFSLPLDVKSGPVRARVPEHAGATVELNCRFKGSRLDNCYSFNVPLPSAAVEAALRVAEEVTLPQMPRPVGRIVIPFSFVP